MFDCSSIYRSANDTCDICVSEQSRGADGQGTKKPCGAPEVKEGYQEASCPLTPCL